MELKKEIWNSMLDADMNARYWKYLVDRNTKKETLLKIFLAIMASGTVASWGFWEQNELLWKILSSTSAIFAIAMPILNYPKAIEQMSELAGKWGELRIEYENMWLDVRNNPDSNTLVKTYKKFRATEISLEKKETKMPNEKKLIRKCYEEVKQSRGLN
jgi:hypothetical protein